MILVGGGWGGSLSGDTRLCTKESLLEVFGRPYGMPKIQPGLASAREEPYSLY